MEQRDNQWASESEWDAPLMLALPQPRCELLDDELCWTINWRNVFRSGLRLWNHGMSSEMRGFHVVFQIRVNESGKLVFWDDDGCIIRCHGEMVHVSLG